MNLSMFPKQFRISRSAEGYFWIDCTEEDAPVPPWPVTLHVTPDQLRALGEKISAALAREERRARIEAAIECEEKGANHEQPVA